MTRVSLALLTFNEEQNVAAVISEAVEQLRWMSDEWELLVIDNNSTDSTVAVVNEATRDLSRSSVRVIVHPENRLYAGSCQTAVVEARGDLVAIMDADGQFSARDLPQMTRVLEAGRAALVLGWRRRRSDEVGRRLTSALFTAMARYYLGFELHDMNAGIRMFNRRLADCARIRHRVNVANPELYVAARRARLAVTEVEVRHFPRQHGEGSLDFSKSLALLRQMNRYFRQLREELHRPMGDQ